MANKPKAHAIIPARYGSTRFPGKALADIMGKPMFQWVYERARSCPDLDSAHLATDDERIAEAARERDVPVIMTRADHASGTDRVYEAARALNLPDKDIVLNVQGDEPALEPAMLSQLARAFADPDVQAATLARRISASQAANPDQVKVVLAKNRDALYFSRAAIPHHRDGNEGEWLGHVGMYGFRTATLARFTSLAPAPLESAEKLEQLRLLENGIPIRVVLTEYESHGVDRPEDVAIVIKMLKKTLK